MHDVIQAKNMAKLPTATKERSRAWEAGKRIVAKQHYSHILTLPKIWVDNYLEHNR